MKKIVLILMLVLVVGCNGQKSNSDDTPQIPKEEIIYEDIDYYIGEYRINPKQKKISKGAITGGVDYEGYGYFEVRDVNFETTSLIFLGNSLFFKEHLPPDIDWETVEIITSGQHFEIFKDKNKIYFSSEYRKSFEIDISEYKVLNNGFYLDKNNEVRGLYFRDRFEFYRVITDEKINFETLRKLTASYYYDKNGLYFVTRKYDRERREDTYALTKVCSSNGKDIKPIVKKKYLIYDKSVYSIEKPLKLDLDVNKIVELTKEYFPNDFSFLTDGKNMYRATSGGYDTISKREKESKLSGRLYLNEIFFSGIDIEYVFSERLQFCQKNSSDIIFFNDNISYCKEQISKIVSKNTTTGGRLIKTSKGYYLLPMDTNFKKAKKINNVYIYNPDTQKEEIFELDKFKYLKDGFFVYKNIFYWGKYMVLTDDFNIDKLGLVPNTNYFTDGKNLFNSYSIQGFRHIDTLKGKVILDKRSLMLNNISDIKRINENLLIVDDSIIASSTNKGIPIPIKKLGIDVKIYTHK